jgi:beta-glucuronidase
LAFDRVPPGNIAPELTASNEHKLPNAAFDFFPFCGLHRPVLLYTQPQSAFEDITVTTDINNTDGIVHVCWQTTESNLKAQIGLHGHGVNTVIETTDPETTFTVPQAAL